VAVRHPVDAGVGGRGQGGAARTEGGGGVVGLGGRRRQQWCSVISQRHGGEREMISLSGHLRGRY
jgi:hypothetical protein